MPHKKTVCSKRSRDRGAATENLVYTVLSKSITGVQGTTSDNKSAGFGDPRYCLFFFKDPAGLPWNFL